MNVLWLCYYTLYCYMCYSNIDDQLVCALSAITSSVYTVDLYIIYIVDPL